jgi:hypothetical protein
MHLLSFIKVFGIPELKSLLKRWMLLSLLLLIVICSLWCIGFSTGTGAFLKLKMDNPFIKFISVVIPYGYTDPGDFKTDLNDLEVKKKYQYKYYQLTPYAYANFQGINGKEPSAFIRPVEPEDEVYQFLLNEPGILLTSNPVNFRNANWSCLVTESYLRKLGYGDDLDVPYITYILPGTPDQYIPIPVAGVVKQLPDNLDLLLPRKLFFAFRGDYYPNPLDPAHHQDNLCIWVSDAEVISKLKEKGFSEVTKETYLKGSKLRQNGVSNPSTLFIQLINELGENTMVRCYSFDNAALSAEPENIQPDRIVFSFTTLDSVRAFQAYLLEKHKLKIDMNTVEAKENFNLFEKISKVLSGVLTLFSVLLIVYIITSVILEHIDKNRKNLGTLKAFGLSNFNIILLYAAISLTLILSIFLGAFAIVSLCGEFLSKSLMTFLDVNIPEEVRLFSLPVEVSLAVWFIIAPLLITVVFLYSKLNNQTPGDLIYERD